MTMFIFDNFLSAIASLLNTLLSIYFWIVLIAAALSFIQPNPYNPVVRLLTNLTEPVFRFLRRKMPFLIMGGLDLSPLVVMLAIQFLQMFVVKSLFQMSRGM